MSFLKIAWFEYRRRIRSKWFILATFGMPLLILGVSLGAGYMAGSGAGIDTKHYVLIDETHRYGPQLVQQLDQRYAEDEAPPLDLALMTGSYIDLHHLLDTLVLDRSLDGYFVIPPDFDSSATLRLYARASSNLRMADVVESASQDILVQSRALDLDLTAAELEALFVNVDVDFFNSGSDEKTENEELLAEYMTPFAFMILLFFGIFTGGQLLLRAVLEERSSRVIEVLLSTVSYNDLMAGKILGLGLLGLTQSVIYLLVGSLAGSHFGLSLITPSIAGLYLVYFALGYLLYAGIYIGTGALFDSEQEAQQAIQIISLVAVVPMLLWSVVIESPNSLLVNVLTYIPLVTPFFMMVKISMGETTLFQIIATVLLMSVSVYGSIRLAAKIFKTGILLYGKRITLPEIWKWIRA